MTVILITLIVILVVVVLIKLHDQERAPRRLKVARSRSGLMNGPISWFAEATVSYFERINSIYI